MHRKTGYLSLKKTSEVNFNLNFLNEDYLHQVQIVLIRIAMKFSTYSKCLLNLKPWWGDRELHQGRVNRLLQ